MSRINRGSEKDNVLFLNEIQTQTFGKNLPV
jgi:hypothetical protein